MPSPVELRFRPLTPERWTDFVALFGPRGACGGCWCMWPRLTNREFTANKGDGNRRAMQRLVKRGHEPGVLGYDGRRAVAWCAIERRTSFDRLARSRILAPVDDQPVWSVTCLFVERGHRGRGVSVQTLRAAVDHAFRRGARIVEGYAIEPKTSPMPAAFAYYGIASAYLEAGFREVARRSETRPIMRIERESTPRPRRKA